MPKLLMLAPCENVLIHRDHDSASLINVITMILLPETSEEALSDAMVPLRWFFFCDWEMLQEDRGVRFEQRLRMTDGEKSYLETNQAFTGLERMLHHRVAAVFHAFPLVPPGTYHFEISIRKVETEDWIVGGSYPIEVGPDQKAV